MKRLKNHKIRKNKSIFFILESLNKTLNFSHCFVKNTTEFSCIYVGHCIRAKGVCETLHTI